jgi:hypothetical protein
MNGMTYYDDCDCYCHYYFDYKYDYDYYNVYDFYF